MRYSCCRNTGSAISSHNKRVIQPTSNKRGCNCSNKAKYQLDVKYLTASIVYKAVLSEPSKSDNKLRETMFKVSFRKHARDFCHKKHVNSTELSKYMWKLKDEKNATLKSSVVNFV